jgi:Fe-S oxidoreductase
VVRLGGSLQRALAAVIGPGADGGAGSSSYPLQLLRSPVPPIEAGTLHDVLPRCGPGQALVLEPEGGATSSVFYFPGCGSERLYPSIAMAALHVLVESGTRVVLPPPFLCCGFPAYANARTEQHGRMVLRDTIIFSQIREMFSFLSFDAVVVTCGTCREGLGSMEAGKIFGCAVKDLARFALDRGVTFSRPAGATERHLYHTPCHDSLDGQGPAVLSRLAGIGVETVPHCCSEAGTLALSRPDITNAMLHRKAAALAETLATRPGTPTVMLTNCPSCVHGLGRNAALGAEPRHIAIELARAISGEGWQDALHAPAARAQVVNL